MPLNTSAISEEAISIDYPEIYESLIPLLRYQPSTLDAFLCPVAFDVDIPTTKTRAHCHFIKLDGNKRPRVKDFAKFVGLSITNFAIPRTEILRALNEAVKLGSTVPVEKLNFIARNLFSELETSGEGGEVLLSILAETYLKLPQLFSKMVLKTNPKVHIHGSDGIHIGVDTTNEKLMLYWGESKLHASAADAVRECFLSLAPFLLNNGGGDAAQERDLQLLRDGVKLPDANLVKALKRFLDPEDPLFNSMEYCGLCLVGFDSEAYPTQPNAKEMEHLRADVVKMFESRVDHIAKRVTAEKIQSFNIQIFCLPFPSVEDFRLEFKKQLGLINE